jgi:hypothetical protein
MKRNSIEFIYEAMNAIASGKHDSATEQCLSDAVEEELLVINAGLVLSSWRANVVYTPDVEVHVA